MPLTAKHRADTARWTKSEADARAVQHGCWFDAQAAGRVVTFFERFLRHSKGEWAGQPFTLLKWQRDEVIKPLFGWMRADGSRRYRMGYIEIPKKNGKSTLCAGLALYGLTADNEPGAEVYSAASSREQASIVFREADTMQRNSHDLARHITSTPSTRHMAFTQANSFYKALAAEAGPVEGLNTSHLFMDEMHVQRDDRLWHALMYGGAARRQPLKVIITTAGVDQESLCYEYHTRAMAILRGTEFDDAFFAYVKSAEWAMERVGKELAEAVWHDEAVWREANPSLGHTIGLESFREDYQAAVQSPRLENAFKRYRLNIWTQQDERWLPMDHWGACGTALDLDALQGQRCWAGLDLASTSDLCALVLWFPDAGNAALPFFWVPQDTVDQLELKGDPRYAQWVREGHLFTTPGNVTDYEFIREHIQWLGEQYRIEELAYDRWNASQLVTQIQGDGLSVVGFGQGYASMSAPAKELEKLILGHQMQHGQQPVLTWNVSNAAVEGDAAGNIKPSKKVSKHKIDGVVAMVMALGVAMARDPEAVSVYETRGILSL